MTQVLHGLEIPNLGNYENDRSKKLNLNNTKCNVEMATINPTSHLKGNVGLPTYTVSMYVCVYGN